MYWMFTGYLASFYAALVASAALTIHSHPRPLHGLAAHFIIIPGMIAALSAEAIFLAPDAWQTKIREAFKHGLLSRVCALCAGFVTGVGVLGCFAIAYGLCGLAHSGRIPLFKDHEKTVFWGSALTLMFIVALAPILPGLWLVTRANRRSHP